MSARRPNQLIKVTMPDGSQKKLWALCQSRLNRCLRDRLDLDYLAQLVAQLDSSDERAAAEARDALLLLNAWASSDLDGRFEDLESLGVATTAEERREIWRLREAGRRDLFSACSREPSEPAADLIGNSPSIGQLAADHTVAVQWARQRRKPLAKPEKPNGTSKPLPCRQFSPEEIKQLEAKRGSSLPDSK